MTSKNENGPATKKPTALELFEQERRAHSKPVRMTIESKVPSKWRFVDLETGDVWHWDEKAGTFKNEKKIPFDAFNTRSIHRLAGLRDDIVDEVAKNNGFDMRRITQVKASEEFYEIESERLSPYADRNWFLIDKMVADGTAPEVGDIIVLFGRGFGYPILGVTINDKRLY